MKTILRREVAWVFCEARCHDATAGSPKNLVGLGKSLMLHEMLDQVCTTVRLECFCKPLELLGLNC